MTDRPGAMPSERDVLDVVVRLLRDRLPSAWQLTVTKPESDGKADLKLGLEAPDGRRVRLVVEVRRSLLGRDVPAVITRLSSQADRRSVAGGVVAARYLSEPVRRRIAEAGLSYVDTTGNLLVRNDSPALYLSDRGADSDPWRGRGRPKGDLKGAPAAKVVRALIDTEGSWRTRELAAEAGVSIGSVYRVLEFLESEGLAVRAENGEVSIPDWVAVLRRWSDDYQFISSNAVTRWIAPRGIPALLDRMREAAFEDYAVTGSVAAEAWEPTAPVRAASIYTPDPSSAAEAWGLRPAESGANVLLARPSYDIAFTRTEIALNGLRLAAPTQVAVDLMTGPGRAPAEAEELLSWMGRNENSWR
ncbi:helix-turn-helix domain-containing protein [Nocardia sp. NPDC055029]